MSSIYEPFISQVEKVRTEVVRSKNLQDLKNAVAKLADVLARLLEELDKDLSGRGDIL